MEDEAVEGLMILRYGSLCTKLKKEKTDLQKERLKKLHSKQPTAVSRGSFSVDLNSDDDSRNYEELYIAETELLPHKVTRSGKRR
jgi:hypothetical protein